MHAAFFFLFHSSLLFLSSPVFSLVHPVPVGRGSGCTPPPPPPPPQQVEGCLGLQNSMAFWEWDNASPPPIKPPKKSASASCLVCGGAACVVDPTHPTTTLFILLPRVPTCPTKTISSYIQTVRGKGTRSRAQLCPDDALSYFNCSASTAYTGKADLHLRLQWEPRSPSSTHMDTPWPSLASCVTSLPVNSHIKLSCDMLALLTCCMHYSILLLFDV